MLKRFNKVKDLFSIGKLSYRENTHSITVFYITEKKVKISKVFLKHEKSISEIQWFLIDLYYNHEYVEKLSIQEISDLLWIEYKQTEYTIRKILSKLKTNTIQSLLYKNIS